MHVALRPCHCLRPFFNSSFVHSLASMSSHPNFLGSHSCARPLAHVHTWASAVPFFALVSLLLLVIFVSPYSPTAPNNSPALDASLFFASCLLPALACLFVHVSPHTASCEMVLTANGPLDVSIVSIFSAAPLVLLSPLVTIETPTFHPILHFLLSTPCSLLHPSGSGCYICSSLGGVRAGSLCGCRTL